jgi:4-amino-4-deoxy-L-arabinose transferase-like glycosyltransferase
MSASTVHRASTGHRAFTGHRASTALRACAGLRARAAALIRRVPRAAWLCALVALANCLAWSLITPPFQVPDENAHYAYVAQVAERGTVPRQILPEGLLSPAEDGTLGALDFYEIVGDPHNPAPFSTLQQQTIEQVGAEGLSRRGDGDALTATNNPPLYYMLEAIPYKLAGGTVLDRLAAMRMLSALMGAVTVLLVYLFLMELLPGRRRTWSVGALAVAFQPMFGFLSGGVNSDDLIYLTAAGTLWAVARMFRRGLTPASGARIGAFLGLGLVTKFTLIGFIPAIALAVALGLWRAWPRHRARALRGGAWALGLVAAPVLVYLAVNRFVWKRDAIAGGVGSVPAGNPSGAHFSFAAELSHIWQLFLPPLWMRHQFNYVPLERTWFKGFIGRFGWLDYTFPEWFYGLAFAVTLLVGALALVTLVRNRRALAGRRGELAVYVLALVGLCVEIGVESYREAILTGTQFEQARYLLPLLGLYAAIVALATRAGGGRWGPVIGAALVMLALGHDLFAQAITIARYYS